MTAPQTYVTTTIPYVNARLHIGFALELVQADVLDAVPARRGGVHHQPVHASRRSAPGPVPRVPAPGGQPMSVTRITGVSWRCAVSYLPTALLRYDLRSPDDVSSRTTRRCPDGRRPG